MKIDNVRLFYQWCDGVEAEGFCCEAAQIRGWLDTLGGLQLVKIDDMEWGTKKDSRPTALYALRHGLALAFNTPAVSQLDVRHQIDGILKQFTERELCLHAIA